MLLNYRFFAFDVAENVREFVQETPKGKSSEQLTSVY
jgi:hypothetical protein